jgi:hypothetical protein
MTAPGLLTMVLVHAFAGAPAPVSIPFHLTPQGAVIVPVTVNGVEAAFVLDTGSTASMVSAGLAALAGARIVARTTVSSAAGRADGLVARIDQLALGPVEAAGVLATVAPERALDLPDLAAAGERVQGILGQDVLASRRFTIDYRRRRLVWRDACDPPPPGAAGLSLEWRDDRFVALVPQEHSTLRLVPDTGTEALVLFRGADSALPPLRPAGRALQLAGVAGSRLARPIVVPRLRVGGAVLTDVAGILVPREDASPGVDGLLPLHLFARVTFNGPERQLLIEDR